MGSLPMQVHRAAELSGLKLTLKDENGSRYSIQLYDNDGDKLLAQSPPLSETRAEAFLLGLLAVISWKSKATKVETPA